MLQKWCLRSGALYTTAAKGLFYSYYTKLASNPTLGSKRAPLGAGHPPTVPHARVAWVYQGWLVNLASLFSQVTDFVSKKTFFQLVTQRFADCTKTITKAFTFIVFTHLLVKVVLTNKTSQVHNDFLIRLTS